MVEWAGICEPAAPALLAPGRTPLSYERLLTFVAETAGGLRAHGLGPHSRVALVVENGPEAATAFLSIGRAAAVAPLNPVYREAELAFFLDDMGADAVVVGTTLDSPVRAVAATGVDLISAGAITHSAPALDVALDFEPASPT